MTWSLEVTESSVCERAIPLMVRPRRPTGLVDFAAYHADALEAALANHAAVLFRGFDLCGEETLALLFEKLWAEPLPYLYRSTPRTNVRKGIYTATEYPAGREIPMHNENAYQRDWPMRIGFHCVIPSETGGQTPLADISLVTRRIGTDLVSQFRDRKVCYVRNYSDIIDLPWQTVFQTDSKTDVAAYCRQQDIDFEWTKTGLTTRQVCQGAAIHPHIAGDIWFNQAQLFHISSMGPEMAANMIDVFADALPRNAYFGDGGQIPATIISHVADAFEQERIIFDWQKDDILVLDNMRIAHGRKPFRGPRRVLVSMACPYSTLRFNDCPAASSP